MEIRDYSAKELQDDVPAIAYDFIDIPNYKFVDFDESNEFTETCLKLDGCMGFSQHDWDCPKFRDYSHADV